jgi:GT2 family glycosyltransferase
LKLIQSLASLKELPREIIIVDGSNDLLSYELIKDFINTCDLDTNFLYVFGPTGLTIQRNAGIDIAKGDIIHFLDDDCIPEQGYFREIENIFENKSNVGAVTGNIVNEYDFKPGIKYKIRCLLGIYKKNYIPGIYYCNGSSVPKGTRGIPYNDEEVDIVSGASMSFRKSVLNTVGDFSEFFSGYSQGEDLEASLRVRRISKVIQSYQAKCNHYHESSSRPDLFKKGFMEIYNRYYIWHFNVKKKTLSCKFQFWGDIIFLHFYALIFWFKSGFKPNYLAYFKGYFHGLVATAKPSFDTEVKRTIFFSLVNHE